MDNFLSLLELFDLRDFDVIGLAIFIPLFLIVWRISAKFVFGPFIELYEAREQATTGAESSAENVLKEAEQLEKDYEDTITQTRFEAFTEKQERVSHAQSKAAEKISQAEDEAKALLTREREASAKEIEELRQSLSSDVDTLVDGLVSKVTDSKVGDIAGGVQ